MKALCEASRITGKISRLNDQTQRLLMGRESCSVGAGGINSATELTEDLRISSGGMSLAATQSVS
jgi:hypothetical protein